MTWPAHVIVRQEIAALGDFDAAYDRFGSKAARWSERCGGRNIWFVRDPVAIAAAKSWGEVAPFFIDLEG